jgi:hypothetical protein
VETSGGTRGKRRLSPRPSNAQAVPSLPLCTHPPPVRNEGVRGSNPRERGATVSRRYGGNQLQPRQALALLGGRGWVAHPDAGVRKIFHREGITATLWVLQAFFTPADVESLTLEEVRFFPLESYEPLTVDSIPSRLFSEVMRDLDLVVSVAYAGVDPETSASTVEMRAALVKETAELLDIHNLRVEQPWVLVDGALGDWSVHLGSANVHRRPGGGEVAPGSHASAKRGHLRSHATLGFRLVERNLSARLEPRRSS